MINPESIEEGYFSNELNKIRAKIMIVENQILDAINFHIQAKADHDDLTGWFAILTDSIQDLKIVSEALEPYGALSAKIRIS